MSDDAVNEDNGWWSYVDDEEDLDAEWPGEYDDTGEEDEDDEDEG